jgi:hypothetical protein
MDQLHIFNFSSGYNDRWYWFFFTEAYPLSVADL